MIGVAPIYAICFAGCVRNTLVLSASLPPCCMRSTAALLQLQLRQGHPTLAQRSSESGVIAQPLLRDTRRAHALRPQPDSELGYLQIFNAGCISGTAHPPLQSHLSHVAGCRHCNHHHHDTGRAHQVPPSDSKRQRSARQVLPPPTALPRSMSSFIMRASDTPVLPIAPSKSSVRAAFVGCTCTRVQIPNQFFVLIKDPAPQIQRHLRNALARRANMLPSMHQ